MADSSSTSAFISTLIIYGLTAVVFVWLFLLLRPKNRRVYEPRSLKDIQTIPEEERTEPVPEGYFGWVEYLLSKPHSFLIQHTSVDGYFLLRYIGIVGSLSFVGCLLLLPILLPVNATNGNNLQGFELLSFSNVTNKNRFYAHVFLSWIFLACSPMSSTRSCITTSCLDMLCRQHHSMTDCCLLGRLSSQNCTRASLKRGDANAFPQGFQCGLRV